MNLDTLGQLHAERARNTVIGAALPPIEQIVEGRRSGRMVAALAWTAVAATAVVVTVLVASSAPDLTPTTLLPVSGGSTTTTSAASTGVVTPNTVIPPSGVWDPILATTRANPAPPAAICPPGTDSRVPGPADQERPNVVWNGNLKAVFDQHAGRIVYVDIIGETWTFDVCNNTWQRANPEGAPVPPEELFDAAGQPSGAIIALVYDADSDVTVAFGYGRISVYDANTNAWTQPENEMVGIGDGLIVPMGVAYDPVTGLIIANAAAGNDGQGSVDLFRNEAWAYDVDTNHWTLIGRLWQKGEDRYYTGDFLGYSEILDRLIFASTNEMTVLVDPRTGQATLIPTDTPYVDIGWPNGIHGPAADTVYVNLGGDDICGFDTNTMTWSDCLDTPATLQNNQHTVFAAMVGDPINQRLILINGSGDLWRSQSTGDVWAIDLNTGQATPLIPPSG